MGKATRIPRAGGARISASPKVVSLGASAARAGTTFNRMIRISRAGGDGANADLRHSLRHEPGAVIERAFSRRCARVWNELYRDDPASVMRGQPILCSAPHRMSETPARV